MPSTDVRARSAFFGILANPWLVLCAVATLAFVLRLNGISRYGFDGDELFSLQAADATWGHLFSTAIHDKSHPPLFYALLKLWIYLVPAEEGWVRLLPVLLGTALIPVTFAICRELRLPTADAAIVILLLSANALLINLSQHARMFALLDLTSATSIYCFIKFIETSLSGLGSTLLTVANLLLVYSHYWGWFVLFAELLILCVQRRKKIVAFLMSVFVVSLGFLPWVVVVAVAAGPDAKLTAEIAWMGSEAQTAADFAYLFGFLNGSVAFGHSTTTGIILFAVPIFLFTARWAKKGIDRGAPSCSPIFWIILILLPILLTSVLGYIAKQNLWATRHLSLVAVSYLVLVGLSVAALPSPLLRVPFRCALVAWAISAGGTFLTSRNLKLHWETIAQAIANHGSAPIYVSDNFIVCPLEYHLARWTGSTLSVTEEADVRKINAQRFWFVYRDVTWRGQDPADLFKDLLDTIDAEISTRTSSQKVTALLVHPNSINSETTVAPPIVVVERGQGVLAERQERRIQLKNITGCYRP